MISIYVCEVGINTPSYYEYDNDDKDEIMKIIDGYLEGRNFYLRETSPDEENVITFYNTRNVSSISVDWGDSIEDDE